MNTVTHENESGSMAIVLVLFVVGTAIGGVAVYEYFGQTSYQKQAKQVGFLVEQHHSCVRKTFASKPFPSDTVVNSVDYTDTGCYQFDDKPPHYEITTSMNSSGNPDTITVAVTGLSVDDPQSEWSGVSYERLHEALDFGYKDWFYRGYDDNRYIFSPDDPGSGPPTY